MRNISYAQCDILRLGEIGRSFDRIECVGVLHHLADPKAGWQVLLSLLKPEGEMRIGLYSELARQSVVDARKFIAERGYRPTADDIRSFRQELMRAGHGQRWKWVIESGDFYNMSDCRDLLFNIVEHRFTIPEIAAFLNSHRLVFLGFDLDAKVFDAFEARFPGPDNLRNLDHWHQFEIGNPDTFTNMYRFSVRHGRTQLPRGPRSPRQNATEPLSDRR